MKTIILLFMASFAIIYAQDYNWMNCVNGGYFNGQNCTCPLGSFGYDCSGNALLLKWCWLRQDASFHSHAKMDQAQVALRALLRLRNLQLVLSHSIMVTEKCFYSWFLDALQPIGAQSMTLTINSSDVNNVGNNLNFYDSKTWFRSDSVCVCRDWSTSLPVQLLFQQLRGTELRSS